MPSKKTLFLVPAPGLKVAAYHELGRHLKPEGERVPDMPEYRRALKHGDVTEGKPKSKKSKKSVKRG